MREIAEISGKETAPAPTLVSIAEKLIRALRNIDHGNQDLAGVNIDMQGSKDIKAGQSESYRPDSILEKLDLLADELIDGSNLYISQMNILGRGLGIDLRHEEPSDSFGDIVVSPPSPYSLR